MNIVGCDLHTRYQQIAMLDKETGELVERRLEHESGEARGFHASLEGPVLGGHRSHTRWFERLLAGLGRCGLETPGTPRKLAWPGILILPYSKSDFNVRDRATHTLRLDFRYAPATQAVPAGS